MTTSLAPVWAIAFVSSRRLCQAIFFVLGSVGVLWVPGCDCSEGLVREAEREAVVEVEGGRLESGAKDGGAGKDAGGPAQRERGGEEVFEGKVDAVSVERGSDRPEGRVEFVSVEGVPERRVEGQREKTLERVPEGPPIAVIQGDLVDWVKKWNYGRDRSNTFQTIDPQKKMSFGSLISAFLKKEISKVRLLVVVHGMVLIDFLDTVSQKRFWLLHEGVVSKGRGMGLYVVPQGKTSGLILEVPHPIKDTNTHGQGALLVREVSAAMLMIASVGRCNHTQRSPCSGTTTQCGGGSYRRSDVAHQSESYFQVAHEVVGLVGTGLQLHGFAWGGNEPSVYLSDGTQAQVSAGALVLKLRDEINKVLKGKGLFLGRSCNDPQGKSVRLCGTTNVQGRYTNGSAMICTKGATKGVGRFFHLEQRSRLRTGTDPGPGYLVPALKVLFPVKN